MAYINSSGELKGFRIYDIKYLHVLAESVERVLLRGVKRLTPKIKVKRLEIINLKNGLIVNYQLLNKNSKSKFSIILFQNSGTKVEKFLEYTFFITEDLSFATTEESDDYCDDYIEDFIYTYSEDLELYTRIIESPNTNDIIVYFKEILDLKFINLILGT